MKYDTKIGLGIVLWLPAYFVGIIIGVIAYGFMSGFAVYKAMDKWFKNSEILRIGQWQ